MLRKIDPSELQPGMRVVRVVFNDLAPLEAEIDDVPQKIDHSAISAIWIDDGIADTFSPELSRAGFAVNISPDFKPLPRTAGMPFEKALAVVEDLRVKATSVAQSCFSHMRNDGELPLDPITDVITDIVSRLDHNADAMLAMRNLQNADAYTWNHCFNVAALAVIFGKYLGYTPLQVHYLGMAGFLHDVGKQFIPLNILNAPRKLSHTEFRIMQRHSELGFNHLLEIETLPDMVKEGILDHHEKVDGSGYPNQKKHGEISPIASIISIVDIFDALSSNRPYKDAMPAPQALAHIYSMRESAFPHMLAERFIRCTGIYPAGSLVALSTGDRAVVQEAPVDKSRGRVIVIPRNTLPMRGPFTLLDLNEYPKIRITGSLDPNRYRINCTQILKTVWQENR